VSSGANAANRLHFRDEKGGPGPPFFMAGRLPGQAVPIHSEIFSTAAFAFSTTGAGRVT
jgi:hypothetical protein